MGIHVGIEHRTRYRFDRAVTLHPHVLRLRPAPHCRTPILAYSLKVSPGDHFINWQQDPFGNFQARLVFPEAADHLDITVDLVADLTVVNPFDFFVEEHAEQFPFQYGPELAADLEPYLRTASESAPLLDGWVATHGRPAGAVPTVDFLVGLNRQLYEDIEYSIRMEAGVQPPEVTLERGIGSCRDSGWLLVEVLRRIGLAARFVSGYLVQLRSDQPSLDGADGPETDFTDLHAWAEVFLPGAGWVGLDATSGLLAGEGHIPLACTPHPFTAAAVTGATSSAEVTLEHSNAVHRVREDPRVTLPYTAAQWERIDELGETIEKALIAGDVRLTMGGEPTFVAIDDMEGPEWNTTADSPAKRALAHDLSRRLADHLGTGALLQYGQGKWYPGEPLPRWQIALAARRDGKPLWRDPSLLADPNTPGKAKGTDAKHLADLIAGRLGWGPERVVDAYEDPVALLWNAARAPAGTPPGSDVEPDDAVALGDGDVRRRALAHLEAQTGEPVGWVLPLHPRPSGDGWQTTEWLLRRGRLYLVPGDSPVGLRLPLDAITWSALPTSITRSAFESRGPLPQPGAAPGPGRVVERHRTPPTALAVQVTDGHLRVFFPPCTHADHAVVLLGVVEDAASELGMAIVLEGYPLPGDPRIEALMVTPDPGVIEVNIAPQSSWGDIRDTMETLYAEARTTRLGTEKFSLDGTHTGTGGGNHVTLGGATPADSPMLRRPDLLVSMLTYWQHHPSLSYLFSGRFIGPTSQAPRVDEGRSDALYELEIAFDELDRAGADASPWTVDRLLRNLLVDLTGNTHRAEFCIDKLFNPDSDRGRLGIVELRGFEMPPHPQMALVENLLIRALVARFWKDPYRGRLVRWGADLYDRFLLPWYVRADVSDVVEDLVANDIDFDAAWLEPFLEFRFPLLGEIELDAVRLELRSAIEPWHVLGEEQAGGGTSRYVDSSVERVQILVEGFNETRHIVTCNGIPVPLHPTSTAGTGVAGVRFKAWAPWSSLHPTIGVHGPLVFDLVDRWSSRSLGGFTHLISHPGGRAYDTFPVNAAEAEARRASRFLRHGHTPGRVDIAALDALASSLPREYPRTLDLRRHPPRPDDR